MVLKSFNKKWGLKMKKFIAYLDKILISISILLFISLILIMFSQIIMRYFFHKPITGVETYSNLLFTWMAFIGCAFATRDNEHLKVNYFELMFLKSIQSVLKKIYKFSWLILVIILVNPYFNFLDLQGNIKVPGVNLKVVTFTYAFMVGFILMIIYDWLPKDNSNIELIFSKKIDKKNKPEGE